MYFLLINQLKFLNLVTMLVGIVPLKLNLQVDARQRIRVIRTVLCVLSYHNL